MATRTRAAPLFHPPAQIVQAPGSDVSGSGGTGPRTAAGRGAAPRRGPARGHPRAGGLGPAVGRRHGIRGKPVRPGRHRDRLARGPGRACRHRRPRCPPRRTGVPRGGRGPAAAPPASAPDVVAPRMAATSTEATSGPSLGYRSRARVRAFGRPGVRAGPAERRRHDLRRGANGVVACLAPVRQQRAEVGERVAERAHLPVEHGDDAARRRRVQHRVVEPVVAVDDRGRALRRQRAHELVAQLVERRELAAPSRPPTASTSAAAGAR